MVTLVNRAKMSTSTTGTGTITLGSAETGYQSFADAGVANGDVVRYVIEDGDNWEIGSGTYTATGTTLTRTVDESSNSDAALNLTGSAVVFITAAADDVATELNDLSDAVGNATTDNYGAGRDVLGDITTGQDNTAFGGLAGQQITTGSSNTFYGGNAGRFVTTGSYNVGVGLNAASGTNLDKQTGDYNIGIGYNAGNAVVSTDKNTAVGYNADNTGNPTGSTAIGSDAVAAGNQATALTDSYASGGDSFAAAIANNTSSYGATGLQSIAIGLQARATAFGSSAFGYGAVSTHAGSSAIGTLSSTTAAGQVSIGNSSYHVRISDAYTLPTSDGTNGQVLTTDGSGAVTFADAGGGSSTITVDSKTAAYTIVSGDVGKLISFSGGSYTASLTAAATLGNGFYVYIENNAANAQSTHVITIDPNASETIDGRSSIVLRQGQRILIVCDGSEWKTVADFNRAIATNARTSFFNLPEASGAESVAIGLGSVASADNTTAVGLNSEASANYATSFGMSSEATAFGSVAAGYNAVSAGSQSIALGVSRASGADSFATAIASNSSSYGATGSNSVAIGYQSKATNTYGVALGKGAQATGNRGYAIGNDSTASATKSGVFGGDGNTASGGSSVAIGGYYANARENNKVVFGGGYLGVSAGTNLNQSGILPLGAITTDATATVMRSDNLTAGTSNQLILPNNSAFTFSGTIIARESATDGSDYASWEIKGALLRDANAASTVLGNGIVNKLYATSGASAWAVALSADTTNGGLKVEVTGAAATNIRWVATVNTSEVTYA